jgi:hypothetical protein
LENINHDRLRIGKIQDKDISSVYVLRSGGSVLGGYILSFYSNTCEVLMRYPRRAEAVSAIGVVDH